MPRHAALTQRARHTPARRPRRVARLAAAVLFGAVVTGCSADASTSGADTGFISGNGVVTVLPEQERKEPGPVAGATIDGEPISLADYAGQTVVVNVWGSWCAPCRAEADDLVAASKELADDDVAFLGIDSRDLDKSAARAFTRRYQVPYPSLYDQGGETLLAFNGTLAPNTIPSTLIIDARGRVAASILGETSKATLIGVVEEVLGSS